MTSTVVNPPLPRRRPNHIPVKKGESSKTVLMTSLHNWVQQVYAAFKQDFPTKENEVVLLGIREMTRTSTNVDVPQSNDTYNRQSGGRQRSRGKLTGKKGTEIGHDDTTKFNDTLFMVWTDSDPAKGTKARVYTCTIDPSLDYVAAKTTGTPYLLEGRAYRAATGPHHGKMTALHVYSEAGGQGHIMLAREATKSVRVFQKIDSALVRKSTNGPQKWEFVGTEANPTIHVHWTFPDKSSKYYQDHYAASQASHRWSAGCTVLGYAKPSAEIKEFEGIISAAENHTKIPYLVVSSAYVRRPSTWVASVGQKTEQLQRPESTLKPEGLVAAPPGCKGYLPSIMTYEFARDVLARADDLDSLQKAVQGHADPKAGSALATLQSLDKKIFQETTHEGAPMHVLPDSVRSGLTEWSSAKKAGKALDPAKSASLAGDLGQLSAALRNSIHRACFETVPVSKS